MISVLANLFLLVTKIQMQSDKSTGLRHETQAFSLRSRLGATRPIHHVSRQYYAVLEGSMALWLLPFVGFSALVLFVLSLLVVEYQDQRARRFDGAKRLRF